MADGQKPTYHLAPNFSIAPPPAGPIHLGSIIMSLESPDVLNEESRIPPKKTWTHRKRGFTATRSRMQAGEYGLWAKFVGNAGVSAEASFSHERSGQDEYRFAAEETSYFAPAPAYLKDSMNTPEMVEWMEVLGHKPVYMVTGLKTARGPSVRLQAAGKKEGKVQAGVQPGEVVPVTLGPKAQHVTGGGHEEAWGEDSDGESSDDFVYGIRVVKLAYKRIWFARNKKGELEHAVYNEGARLVGADGPGEGVDDDVVAVDLDDEMVGKEIVQMLVNIGMEIDQGPEGSGGDGTGQGHELDETWVVPSN
jgi:hypothetical protein